MKALIILTFLFSSTAFASKTLLRCNIPWGELQEVTVKVDGAVFTLTQLNNSGSFRTYPMTEKQWLSKRIPLKLSWGDKALLSMKDGGWIYRSDSEYYVLNCDQY